MDREERGRIELDLLLEALFRGYGYDFRSYARQSVERRARRFLSTLPERSLSELIPRVLADETFAGKLVRSFSVTVSEMFRNPEVYKEIRKSVIPMLRTYPSVRIWHAGCASGEEVYSMAILLREEGLLERATLYATDFNDDALCLAQAGIYPLKSFQEATQNYQAAGGGKSFSSYYQARRESVVIDPTLRERVTFNNHNLVSDGVFGEMHMVFCRNVLIYFSRELQQRVLGLFADSLMGGGFLCLGSKESLRLSSVTRSFESVGQVSGLFQKQRTLSDGENGIDFVVESNLIGS